LAAIGEMSAAIAHEINNPLVIIRLQNERLLERANSEAALLPHRNALSKVNEMVLRISQIIRSLRSLAGQSEQDPFQEVSLQTLVADSLDWVRDRYHSKNFPIRVQLDEPSIRIECRPLQIHQVLVNLLNNAWDALNEKLNREPQSRPFVEIRSECDHDEQGRPTIRIHVIDTGVGMTSETIQNLGKPLFSTKGQGVGMGLGLRLSQAIVESHSGTLAFSALPEYGMTRFSVTLPVSQNKPLAPELSPTHS
jgi:C4-dicarboxylate-specific signal transduction histidine kinase